MRVVVVEGIDRVGKTTFIQALKAELEREKLGPVVVFKDEMGLKKKDEEALFLYESRVLLTEKLCQMMAMLMNLKEVEGSIILDRFHATEYVYGLVSRKYVNAVVPSIDALLESIDATFVLITPEDIKRSSKEHGSDLSEHAHWMERFYEDTSIKKKFRGQYSDIKSLSHQIAISLKCDAVFNQKGDKEDDRK